MDMFYHQDYCFSPYVSNHMKRKKIKTIKLQDNEKGSESRLLSAYADPLRKGITGSILTQFRVAIFPPVLPFIDANLIDRRSVLWEIYEVTHLDCVPAS